MNKLLKCQRKTCPFWIFIRLGVKNKCGLEKHNEIKTDYSILHCNKYSLLWIKRNIVIIKKEMLNFLIF